ncbi:MAG: type II toxin-antitoxin system Phd/YefM family antitoxin [Oscillospiraceae bacterium]|nr:type II toxin-antitoxin system Phd/YefM family antitoxin [Oscillospiraceae bacterium]
MPTIRPSADLRNSYNEISEFCHEYNEPVFITKNGKGDLVVMSIEAYEQYEQLKSRLELYSLLGEGLEAVRQGKVRPASEVIADIRKELNL